MTILLNVVRGLMAIWILYGLALIFAPQIIHRAPDQTSGIVQVVAAYVIGYLVERVFTIARRRRSAAESEA